MFINLINEENSANEGGAGAEVMYLSLANNNNNNADENRNHTSLAVREEYHEERSIAYKRILYKETIVVCQKRLVLFKVELLVLLFLIEKCNGEASVGLSEFAYNKLYIFFTESHCN